MSDIDDEPQTYAYCLPLRVKSPKFMNITTTSNHKMLVKVDWTWL